MPEGRSAIMHRAMAEPLRVLPYVLFGGADTERTDGHRRIYNAARAFS